MTSNTAMLNRKRLLVHLDGDDARKLIEALKDNTLNITYEHTEYEVRIYAED